MTSLPETTIAMISLFGIVNCLFLGALFLKLKKGNKQAHFWLGLLFILLALRLGKLAAQTFTDFTSYYFNVMHAAWLALGPTLLFYLKYYRSPKQSLPYRFLHYVPALLFLFFAKNLRSGLGEETWQIIYLVSFGHMFVYLILALINILDTYSNFSSSQQKWLFSVWGIVSFIWMANMAYYFFHFPFYIITALLTLVILYLLTFLAFQYRFLYFGGDSRKYKNLALSNSEKTAYLNQLKQLLEEEKLYLDPDIQLPLIAKRLSISQHLLSRIINEHTRQNFPTFINSFRIKAAKENLIQHPKQKILTIAFDVGFRSLSTFNASFKKHTGSSPSEYRRRYHYSKGDPF